ncbi:hypothetical protein [Micromonospora sp. b486]|uniref:hypothetical protein n=1 Tax=Micromonospora sp. b486 TaxID=3053986 RepID=UPI00259CAE95|nr:hypothetical protein [Micromonospora sp. b486]MDM4777829.1 hypothetical protein [Micromonospora sp. b486]
MNFDPLATARRALWVGGAQWAGKTTLAVTLALRYGLTAYLYDRHDARGHDDRRIADRSDGVSRRTARTRRRPG